MNEKNSVNMPKSRYVSGGSTETNQFRLEWWERTQLVWNDTDSTYVVEPKSVGRLDLIASAFLGDSHLWWLIAQYNAILDPFNEVTVGRTLRIPSKDHAQSMLGGKLGGYQSTREVPLTNITSIV